MVNHKRSLNKSFKIPPNFSMIISGCSIYYNLKACTQIDEHVTKKNQWDIVLHWHREIHSFFQKTMKDQSIAGLVQYPSVNVYTVEV